MKLPRFFRNASVLVLAIAGALLLQSASGADPVIPPTWDIVDDDFESGTLDVWDKVSAEDLELIYGGGINGSTGLSVSVSQGSSYLYRSNVARAEEGYSSFWFDPNSAVIPDEGMSWVPGKSICVAAVVHSEDWWPPLVALYVRKPVGQSYQAYLAWPIDSEDSRHYDHEAGSFDLLDGWQKITVGYHIDEWVAVWHNGQLMRYATNVVHTDPYGDIIQLGKVNSSSNTPSGALRFDEYAFQVPRVDHLWTDAVNGNDENDGLTSATAFRTIQEAADRAGPGTTVHILPGIYRETVWPALNGSSAEAARYVAESGARTAIIRGSEPSSSLNWTQLAANTIGLPPQVDPTSVYYADLSAWELDGPPRFIIELDSEGEVIARLPLAREPDW